MILLMFCLQQQNKQNLKELALVGTFIVNTVKYYVGITRPSKCDENKLPEYSVNSVFILDLVFRNNVIIVFNSLGQ